MNTSKWFGVGIVVIVLVTAAYFMGQSSNSPAATSNSNSSAQPSQPTQTSEQQPPKTQNTNDVYLVALKSKCTTDGQSFVRSYEQENGSQKTVWQTPEFHYDTKLNTCLVYIGYVVQTYQSPIDFSNPSYNASLIVYNFVFDIYSNKAILQNVADRESHGGQNTDTPSPYPNYSNVANLDWATFNQQMQVLMSE